MAQQAPIVQWWLAELGPHGNPKLIDGAHSERSGADRAAYLIGRLGLAQGKRYAVARVELSDVTPNRGGVNESAIDTINRARR